MTVRVLIVDDQEPFRMAARMVVEATEGFEVAGEAETGEDSVTIEFDIDAATRETPDNTTTLYRQMPYLLTTWTGPGTEAAQARGTVDLYFKLAGSGNWAITRWVDKLGDDKQIPSLGSRIEPGSGHTET